MMNVNYFFPESNPITESIRFGIIPRLTVIMAVSLNFGDEMALFGTGFSWTE
jgi:hypothetical protein